MKIKSLLIGMLACSAMVACTNTDEPEVDNGGAKGNEYYVSVAFSMPGNSSRAASLGGFESGTTNEVEVKNAIFYFLNDAGNSVANACYVPTVQGGFTWTSTQQNPTTDNVDALTNSVIVMKNPTEIPSRIVAIVNAGDLSATSGLKPTLAQLQAVASNYATETYTAMPASGMVMSSTSYMDANNKLMIGAPVTAANIFESSTALNKAIKEATTDAMDEVAVVIPVEKVLAKVAVLQGENMNTTDNTLGSLTDKGATDGAATSTTSNVTLTVSIDGWWLDSTPTQSYLLKNIDNVSVGNWWNDLANTRSYWANSYVGTNPAQAYANDQYGQQAALGESLYTQENTSQATTKTEQKDDTDDNVYEVNNRTKVVVAATLKNGNTAVDLVKWYGNYYTKDGFLISLANLNDVKKYYTKSGETYSSLTSAKLKIVSNGDKALTEGSTQTPEIGTGNQDNITVNGTAIRNYEAVAVLNLAEGEKLYTLTVENGTQKATEVTNLDAVNEELKKISKVQYWNGGKTYYYVEIEHNTVDATTYFGVVRNHLYKLTLERIKGLGTPVPNPDKIIIPEKPGDSYSETYISAKIEILAYKVVSQSVTLQ